MVTVDSKGRIVLPQELRERLGIAPGTEVEIREQDGKAVVEPEDDPDQIIERLERLVEESTEQETAKVDDATDPIALRHRQAVRDGAAGDDDE
jgi:AbrB family looped-hinge helix DNA binding protein